MPKPGQPTRGPIGVSDAAQLRDAKERATRRVGLPNPARRRTALLGTTGGAGPGRPGPREHEKEHTAGAGSWMETTSLGGGSACQS